MSGIAAFGENRSIDNCNSVLGSRESRKRNRTLLFREDKAINSVADGSL
jgi:hypothetical protein